MISLMNHWSPCMLPALLVAAQEHVPASDGARPFPWVPLAIYLVIFAAGIVGSSAFSGIETACYTMSRLRLLLRASAGDRNASTLRTEMRDMPRLISVLLIGNNIANYATSFGITAILGQVLFFRDTTSIALQALLLTPLLFLFGETLPKEWFRAHADAVIYRFARFMFWMRVILTVIGLLPIVNGIGRLLTTMFGTQDSQQFISARARTSAFLHEGVGHGVLSQNQIDIVNRALSSGNLKIHELMTPWRDVRTIRNDAARSTLRRQRLRWMHSRYPVVSDDGRVVGIVALIDALVAGDGTSMSDVMVEPIVLHPNQTVREALEVMREAHAMIAIVGSLNQPTGIISRKDLLDPLLGTLAAA